MGTLPLNDKLQPLNSPIANRDTRNTGYNFDSINERGAVTNSFLRDASITNAKIGTAAIGTANIGTLSFNEISGGTANLGGTTNGDGVLSVQNVEGTEIVQINNEGITVTGGSISINNSSGSTILDSSGLVSVQNFTNSNLTKTSGTDQFITGTALTDITNATFTVSPTRDTVFLFFFDVNFYAERESAGSGDWAGNIRIRFSEDLAEQEPGIRWNGEYNSTSGNEWYRGCANAFAEAKIHYLTTLSSGSHTIKLVTQLTTDNDCQFRLVSWRYSYIQLGS